MLARGLFGIVALSVFMAGSAGADEEPHAGLMAPSLKFELTPAATGTWRFKIENTGDTPVRLAADPRLLSFDVGGQHCTLPEDARPTTDEGRELIVPGKRAWSASFDPLFYCFGAHERAALVSGAVVKAHFGWRTPPKAKTAGAAGPFAVAPVGASVGKLSPLREIDADPVTMTDGVKAGPDALPDLPDTPAAPEDPFAPPPAKVSLTLPATMDASRGVDLTTTVTLHNESDRAITLMFRPDMVQFMVDGPAGPTSCGAPKTITAPIRELFVTVGAKSQTSLGVLFTATCNAGTFDEPGLYHIAARLETTHASGRAIDLKSWDGVAVSKEPLLLRVRQARHPGHARRPQLD